MASTDICIHIEAPSPTACKISIRSTKDCPSQRTLLWAPTANCPVRCASLLVRTLKPAHPYSTRHNRHDRSSLLRSHCRDDTHSHSATRVSQALPPRRLYLPPASRLLLPAGDWTTGSSPLETSPPARRLVIRPSSCIGVPFLHHSHRTLDLHHSTTACDRRSHCPRPCAYSQPRGTKHLSTLIPHILQDSIVSPRF